MTSTEQTMQDSPDQLIDKLDKGFFLEGWKVLPRANTLRPPGTSQPRHIEPKAMQVLLQLAARSGEFVSREQLLETVWNTQFVTEDVLTGAIAAIRKALGDDPKQPRFIETRRGIGYRLIAPVLQLSQASAFQSRFRWRLITAIATSIIMLLALAAKNIDNTHLQQVDIPTIAVLPFADYSKLKDNHYFADAVTESLIQKLAELQQFRVISRTSVMPYRDTGKNAREIARELGVDWFVEGSVMHHQQQVRITAQLIDAVQDEHLWAGQFDRPFTDTLTLISDVVTAISLPILKTAQPAQPAYQMAETSPPLPPEQMESLLMAHYLLTRESPDATRQALRQFSLLSQQYPDYFAPHLGKAQALLWLFKQSEVDQTALDSAYSAVQRSLELNPQASAAYRCRGQILFFRDLDYLQAESDYLTGISLNNSDHVARRRYAWLLVAQQRHEEATRQLDEIKKIDPIYYADAANALLMLYTGDTDNAIADLERLKASSPDSVDIHSVLWRSHLAIGQQSKATGIMLEWLRLRGLQPAQQAPLQKLLNQQAYSKFYRSVLQQQLITSPLHQAMLQLQIGDVDAAIALVEHAWDTHNPAIAYLPVMPNLRALHDHPRFSALLGQLPTFDEQHKLSAQL